MNEDPDLAPRIAGLLRDVPDFPKAGVLFKDISPVLADGGTFAAVIQGLAATAGPGIDFVAGIEARGFLLSGALAVTLGCGLLPVRKADKLPPPTMRRRYDLEYGSAEIEVPHGIPAGKRILLVDDVLATGGTLRAAAELLADAGADVIAMAVIIELTALGGRGALAGLPRLHSLLQV